jgi:hypothetical protein
VIRYRFAVLRQSIALKSREPEHRLARASGCRGSDRKRNMGEIGVVPYTAHLNDLHNFLDVYDLAQFELLLKEEFDQLYDEGAKRRRMMVVSLHDRIGTRPASIRMFDRVFDHMRRKENVWFARKDEVARWALTDREHTPVVRRGPAGETGLPGPAA